MSAAVVTSVLIIMLVFIVALLIGSVWREYPRNKYASNSHNRLPAHPLDRHVTAILHLHEGQILSIEKPIDSLPPIPMPSPWYYHRRALVSVSVLVLFALALFAQTGLAGGTLKRFSQSIGLSTFNTTSSINTSYQPARHLLASTASSRVIPLDSIDPRQYHNSYELQTWSYSSCSGFAMVMVFDAYGQNLIAADVLQEELKLGVWDLNLGLLGDDGIAKTADHFGFQTDAGRTRTLQQVIDIANSGSPVIVSVRDAHYYPGGHIFVIRGGDSQNVFTADSAPTHFRSMPRTMFAGMWQTFSAVVTPRN